MSLLEVLVAFVIAMLGTGVVIAGSGDSVLASRVAIHREQALSRARSRLAAAGPAFVPGEQSGDDGGGFAWSLQTTPATPAGAGAKLYTLTATITWRMDGGERRIRLTTERLAPPEPRR